jgi:quercetin dioxygenase-like cupin family protein
MKVMPHTDVPLEDVKVEGAKGVKIRWLISQKDNAPNFALRLFEVEVGGFTPYHSHSFEHEVYVVEGEGVFVTEEKEHPFQKGDIIYADPDLTHQFRNAGKTTLKFLCIVPLDNPKPKQEEEKPYKTVNPFAAGKVNNC